MIKDRVVALRKSSLPFLKSSEFITTNNNL